MSEKTGTVLPKIICTNNDVIRTELILKYPVLEQVLSTDIVLDQTLIVIDNDYETLFINEHGIMFLSLCEFDEMFVYIREYINEIAIGVPIMEATDSLLSIITGMSGGGYG